MVATIFCRLRAVLSVRKLEQHLRTKVKSFKWFPLTAKEFFAFLVNYFFHGNGWTTSAERYWNNYNFFGQDFVRNSGMTRHSFQNILAALHICNLEDLANERKKKAGQNYDPLLKVQPLLCWHSTLKYSVNAMYIPINFLPPANFQLHHCKTSC